MRRRRRSQHRAASWSQRRWWPLARARCFCRGTPPDADHLIFSHVQAKQAGIAKERMKAQEAEIAALRRQLESMQVAASRARAGGGGRRQYDGSVPAEYICPVTQVGSCSFLQCMHLKTSIDTHTLLLP